MIVEYVRYEVTDGVALVRAYEEARRSLDTSPHCQAYELTRSVDDPRCFVLRIEWDSADGHLKGFRTSAEFGRFFAAVKPFVGDIKEMRHYARTPVVRER